MNFYEHQARARRNTALLGLYFILAVVLIVFALNAVAFLGANLGASQPIPPGEWFQRPWWGVLTALVLAIIVGNTLWTSMRLAGGGPALANMLGARRVLPETREPDERRLINVVEEMSIASGVPVPMLYVLDQESAINAFVAGARPTEAVMVVTRGTLEQLSRDELQGVVAHEYSHIFNHDMSLNIQLMGALAGLIVIGQIGRMMMHSGSHSRNGGQLVALGVGVLAIGYVGTFFGALIKAAISRQREFLADASAVQYTRDPTGIANALYRIDTHAGGSLLNNSHAEDIGHFCFGESVHYILSGVMATHPPIKTRIKTINPAFVAPPPRQRPDRQAPAADEAATARAETPRSAGSVSGFAASAGAPLHMDGAVVAESVGTLEPQQLAYGQNLHATLAAAVLDAVHSPTGAAHLMFALLLEASASDAYRTIIDLIDAAPRYDAAATEQLLDEIRKLPARVRLPLINMALPSLKLDSPAERSEFLQLARGIIAADQHFSVFEFALEYILVDHLDAEAPRSLAVRFYKFSEVETPLQVLLSALAHAGSAEPARANTAFSAAWRPFGLDQQGMLARTACGATELGGALEALASLSPLLKKNVIQACADCVIHDFDVTASEAELLQAIALGLDCPLPALSVG